MKPLRVLSTELIKLRRSRVTWLTLAAYTFMVVVVGLFLWMMRNPGAAAGLGLLGQKASFAFGGGPLDWRSFFGFIVELGGLGGLVLSSIIVTYLFGREYAEGTAKNLLALPIARSRFVLAKIVVSAGWFAVLTAWILATGYLVGSLVGLGPVDADLLFATAGKLFALAAMSLACAMLVAWVAVEARGYFAPLGFTFFTMVLASLFGHTGWAPWVPWSIIGIYSGAAGPAAGLGWGSVAVVAATFLLGAALTVRHEVYADNAQ